MSIVLDVDVDPLTTPWDPAKAYLFVPLIAEKYHNPLEGIDWCLVEKIVETNSWNNPLQRARPDVYLGTNERTLGGDRREYGFGKLRHGMAFGHKVHPTYGIRGAVAQFDVVKASGFLPSRDSIEPTDVYHSKGKLQLADSCIDVQDLVGRIVTAAHSGKRFYVDSVRYDMNAENSFPRKEGYLGPLEYSSYADYYRQKYGVDLRHKKQPLIRGRGVSYCKNLLSPRFEHSEEVENEENLDKTYYVYLPPELCLIHPLPGALVRGAQRLPSIMRRIESMLLAVQLKDMIRYPVPAMRILEALTAASCQETFCYERAELLGDAYLKWVVSIFLFLKYPQKHEGQLTRMRQQMVSNMVLYQYALNKGLQSYIQADRFAPSRWAAPGVLPVFDEDSKETEYSIFDEECPAGETEPQKDFYADDCIENMREDGEVESDSSCYRVLSSKTLADVVEALIGVYYVEGGENAANHLMRWIGIQVDLDPKDFPCPKPYNIPESIMRSVDFDAIEGALNVKFKDRGLLVEAITHASRPSSGVSCYQRLEFVGDAVLDHLITKHLFFTYTNLPPGRLTDLRAAAVNNENFARVAVKHKLHVYLRHGSSALEAQIRDFVKDIQDELAKEGFNYFGLGDCKAPKVLGDIVESIAGAIFLDNERDAFIVWKVFQPLLHPMVTPETLPMHPVRELQERCQQQAEGLEYKATRTGNIATVEVFIDGVQIGIAQNPQKKMAQKLAARNALVVLNDALSSPRLSPTMPATLRIPDILAAMDGFELRTHPDERQVTRASNEWFASYNMLPRNKWEEFVKSEFGLLVGMAYPDTDTTRLRITSDYMSILFTYDDLMDLPSSDLMHDKIGADKAAKIMMSVLTNPADFKPVPGMPVASAFHDFWVRYCETSTPAMQKRFIDATYEYVMAARNQVGNRERKECPTIEEYVALRRDTSAIKVTYACVEYCLGIDVPDVAFYHPVLDSIQEAGNDILSWANDIYSFDNEQACGDCHNLVAVVSIQKNITIQAAIEYVNSMILSAIDRFFTECARVPSFGPEIDPIVQAYIKGVEVYISGSVFWHLESERYFGSQVRQVKDTLTVQLRPLEPGAKPAFEMMYTLPHILRSPPSVSSLRSAPSSVASSVHSSPRTQPHALPALPPLSTSLSVPQVVTKATLQNVAAQAQHLVTRRTDVTNILVFTSILLASSPVSLIPFVPLVLLLLLPEPPVAAAVAA